MRALSSALLALGFLHVSGITVPKRSGKYCQNNGVIVVYDQIGEPWIIRCQHLGDREMDALIREHGIVEAFVHVPHSNDGGAYLRNHKPSVDA